MKTVDIESNSKLEEKEKIYKEYIDDLLDEANDTFKNFKIISILKKMLEFDPKVRLNFTNLINEYENEFAKNVEKNPKQKLILDNNFGKSLPNLKINVN